MARDVRLQKYLARADQAWSYPWKPARLAFIVLTAVAFLAAAIAWASRVQARPLQADTAAGEPNVNPTDAFS